MVIIAALYKEVHYFVDHDFINRQDVELFGTAGPPRCYTNNENGKTMTRAAGNIDLFSFFNSN